MGQVFEPKFPLAAGVGLGGAGTHGQPRIEQEQQHRGHGSWFGKLFCRAARPSAAYFVNVSVLACMPLRVAPMADWRTLDKPDASKSENSWSSEP